MFGRAAEIFAIRIGRSFDRWLGVLVGGESLTSQVELAYYVWLIRSVDGSLTVVDAAFSQQAAHRRGISFFSPVAQALKEISVEPSEVERVIVSHLHWDHAGDIDAFRNARIHVSKREWEWTMRERELRRHLFSQLYDESALQFLSELPNYRVHLMDGSFDVAPGVTMEVVGGHTPGHAVIHVGLKSSIDTVLLGDLGYLYSNILRREAPLLSFDPWGSVDAYDELAHGDGQLIPGHDPLILDRLTERLSENVAVLR